jgi:GDP-L-fucose synthase
MNIFFTGHRGFLGKSCIPHLQNFHEVFTSEIDLTNDHDLEKFLYENKIDFIIHAAVRAGRRNEPDTAENLYDNLLMFENLSKLQIPMINFCSGAAYDRRFSIEDVSEGDLGKSIPTDNYGLSKYIISKRIHSFRHGLYPTNKKIILHNFCLSSSIVIFFKNLILFSSISLI